LRDRCRRNNASSWRVRHSNGPRSVILSLTRTMTRSSRFGDPRAQTDLTYCAD
jgi:hypothetical protein